MTESSVSVSQREGKSREKQIRNKKNKHKRLIANLFCTRYAVVRKVIQKVLKFKVQKQNNGNDWDIFWTDSAVQPQQLENMKAHQKINHFPGMYVLSRKNYLARHLYRMNRTFPQEYDFHPLTWTLPSEFGELKQYLEGEGKAVIGKPQASCQGRGIFLSRNIEDFEIGQHYVVQRYIERPFLLEGLKFDFRVYVLVAGCDPLRAYVFKEGLVRFATEPYQIPRRENLNNLFMHLTNYAINKVNAKFQYNKSQDEMNTGHKRSISSVLSTLQKQCVNTEQLWKNIKDIIAKTLIVAQPSLAHHYRSCQPNNLANNMCFEILGFDILIDEALKPYVLEVNYTPSFTTDTPLDNVIKQNLIRDTLILLNVTSKAKVDAIAAANKILLSRTLTGKKIWHAKEEREELIQSMQRKRNLWEDSHLGQFQKILPYQTNDKRQKYQAFLNCATQAYLSRTGGNIKRTEKTQVKQEKIYEPLKWNQPDQLQKIYIKKNKKNIPNSSVLKNQSVKLPAQRIKQQNSEKINSVKLEQRKYKLNPYRRHQTLLQKKVEPISQKIYPFDINQENTEFKRSSSAHPRKIVSKVYDITFKEIKRKQIIFDRRH